MEKISRFSKILILLTLVFITFTITLYVAAKYFIHKQLQLNNGTIIYKSWKDPPANIYTDFYFFNITNPDEILKGEKPILNRIGPFTYSVKLQKNPHFNNNNTVTFRETKTWHYEYSLYLLSTQITTINVPLLTLFSFANFFFENDLNFFDEPLFIKKSVSELLFEGYKDILVTLSQYINPHFAIYKGKFGYMRSRNGSSDGLFVVSTEENKVNLIQKINNLNTISDTIIIEPDVYVSPNQTDFENLNDTLVNKINFMLKKSQYLNKNSSHNSYNNSVSCISFNDSNKGELRPLHQKNSRIYISDFCRTIPLNYNSSPEGELKVDRYTFGNIFNDSGDCTDNLNKIALCQLGVNCKLRKGLMDISRCFFGAPILLSLPYFEEADQWYKDNIIFINKSQESIKNYFDCHSYTGTTVEENIEVQVNIGVYKPKWYPHNVPKIVFPIFIQKYHGKVNSEMLSKLLLVQNLLSLYPLVGIGISFSLVMVCIISVMLNIGAKSKTKEDESPFVDSMDENNN